jgi:hypothetical protein
MFIAWRDLTNAHDAPGTNAAGATLDDKSMTRLLALAMPLFRRLDPEQKRDLVALAHSLGLFRLAFAFDTRRIGPMLPRIADSYLKRFTGMEATWRSRSSVTLTTSRSLSVSRASSLAIRAAHTPAAMGVGRS